MATSTAAPVSMQRMHMKVRQPHACRAHIFAQLLCALPVFVSQRLRSSTTAWACVGR